MNDATVGKNKPLFFSMEFLRDTAAAVMSGVMLGLSFPDYNLWPLAWPALVPLLYMFRRRNVFRAFFLGFAGGFVYFGMTLFWVSNTMIVYASMAKPLAWGVTGLMMMALATYTGLVGYIMARIGRAFSEDVALAAAPFVWTAIELARSSVPELAFTWAKLGQSQYLILPVIQIADIAGENGLSFVIVIFAVGCVKLADYFFTRNNGARKFPARWVTLCFGMTALTVLYGYYRLHTLQFSGDPVKTAIIQGNVDQERKFDPSYLMPQLDIYSRRTYQAAMDGAKLVVWPETAAAFYFGQDRLHDPMIYDLAKDTGATLLFGAPAFEKRDKKYVAFNRSWLVKPDGTAQSFDKFHLVPFGEYVPFRTLLFFVGNMVEMIGDMEPGTGVKLLDAGEYKAGAQICYEIIFPQYSRKIANDGGAVVINITNDTWYGESPASVQSMAMAVLRAVENRIPVLRAAQSGVSSFIDPTGRIVKETKLFEETTLIGEFIPKHGNTTFYMMTGDMFGWTCLVITTGFMIAARRKKKATA